MLQLTGKRLHIREVTADDLPLLLPVYTSNPEYVQQNEGSEGEIGRYDLERWQRDWHISQMMPGSHWLGCYLQTNNTPVGTVQFLEENDADGQPWLGSLTIHKDYQHQGLGTEIWECLIAYFRLLGWTSLRAGVKAPNTSGLAFAQRLGFQTIGQGNSRFADGIQSFVLLEYTLEQ